MGYKSPWIMHRYGSVLLWYALPYTRFIHIVLTMNQLSQVTTTATPSTHYVHQK